jgi:hypothetical protein
MTTAEKAQVQEERERLERRIEEDRAAIKDAEEKREKQRVLAQRTSKKLSSARRSLRRAYG